jgi:putative ubiquitin-RnfH superfamily antitoxin RatB of RatAB toxin-antitoxin module
MLDQTNLKNTAIETVKVSLNFETNRVGLYGKTVEFLHSYLDHTMDRGGRV